MQAQPPLFGPGAPQFAPRDPGPDQDQAGHPPSVNPCHHYRQADPERPAPASPGSPPQSLHHPSATLSANLRLTSPAPDSYTSRALYVPGPAEPLVALRAVDRDVEELPRVDQTTLS